MLIRKVNNLKTQFSNNQSLRDGLHLFGNSKKSVRVEWCDLSEFCVIYVRSVGNGEG